MRRSKISPFYKIIRRHQKNHSWSCESLPHRSSHYTQKGSKLNYFDDSSLSFKILYAKFTEFYKLKTGINVVPIKESTYCKYFNHFVNFSFEKPKLATNVIFIKCNEDLKVPNAKITKEKSKSTKSKKKKRYQKLEIFYALNLTLDRIFLYQNYR